MKNTLRILTLTVAAIIIQSCQTKSNEQEADGSKSETVATPSATEKRALAEKQRLEFISLTRLEYQARLLETPFYTNSIGVQIFNKAEVEPYFKGGDDAMNEYLSNNLIYPAEAKADGLEGTIFVDFVIDSAGQVTEVEASSASWGHVNKQLNEEAVRVVSSMPNWIPGTQHGSPVNVAFNVPISFRAN